MKMLLIYSKETDSHVRQKRAIPLGLIFTGVSAIGGLIMKGVNTWSNYKKSKAMTQAVEKLYEAPRNRSPTTNAVRRANFAVS